MRQGQDIQRLEVLEGHKAFKSEESKITSTTKGNDWIPADWKFVSLGDVCSLRNETVQPTMNQQAKYVGLEHIDSGVPFLERWGVASEVISSKSKFYIDDVLYGKLRPYLDKAVLSEFEGICSTDILVFKTGSQIISTFLSYFVHTHQFLDYAVQNMHGVNHPRTSWASIAKYQFSLPPSSQQKAIAHLLLIVYKSIQAKREELKLERERKSALMEYLFTQGTHREPLKQTEIGKIPVQWDLSHLGEVVQLKNGINFRSEQKGHGTLTVDVMNMYSDDTHLQMGKLYRVDIDLDREYLLQANDILFVRSSLKQEGVGWPALFSGYTEPVTFCGFLIRARLTNLEIDPDFLINYLRLPAVRRFLVSKSGKVAITNINQKSLEALPIPLPSFSEQIDIAKILKTCDDKIVALKDEIALLKELNNALLEELMTGRISTLPLVEEEVEV